MAKTLVGRQIGDWTLKSIVDNGKSALVMKATNSGGKTAAVKVFDPEIVEQFGVSAVNITNPNAQTNRSS
jgi:serine/threonine-protein kinase RIO1